MRVGAVFYTKSRVKKFDDDAVIEQNCYVVWRGERSYYGKWKSFHREIQDMTGDLYGAISSRFPLDKVERVWK